MALFSKRTAGKPVSKQGGSIHVTPVRGAASIEKPDFEDVYGTFYPQVLRFVYSRLNRWQLASWQLAEDIAQEVMMACYRHYEKFDPARASLKTWVFVIARNRLKNYYRSLHDEESMDAKEGFDLPSGEELVEEAVAFEESRALLKAEIAQLSERERILSGIIRNAVFGPISDFYDRMIRKQLINPGFGYNSIEVEGAMASVFQGMSRFPEALRDEIFEEIERVKREGISPRIFECARRSSYGGNITAFNCTEDIADNLQDDIMFGIDTFGLLKAAASVTVEEANELFRRQYDISNSSLSVVRRSKEA